MIKLSIITPVYNNYKFTEQYLKDLIQLPIDHEIIIIDNNSTDKTFEIVEQYKKNKTDEQPEIIYIKNSENLGFARASNQGYDIARGLNVLFLNNDIKVKSNFNNWTQDLINKCDKYIVGPTGGILDKNCNFIKETSVLDDKEYSFFYMSGWCLAGSKNNFNKLKKYYNNIPFPINLGKGSYFEDSLMSYYLSKLDIKFNLQNVPVIHFGKMTSRLLNLSDLYQSARVDFIKIAGEDIKNKKVKWKLDI